MTSQTALSLKQIYRNLSDEPLEPGSPFYEPVYQELGLDDPESGQRRLFGKATDGQLLADRLIEVCGGHFRDLLRLLRDLIARATALPALPVTGGLIDTVINSGRRDFLPIAKDDAKWLQEISDERACALPDRGAEAVNRLARFLDSHFALYFTNANDWYDIHPMIRAEVAVVIRSTSKATG